MSRVGKRPIAVPSGVTVAVKDRVVDVSGSLGKLSWQTPACVAVTVGGDGREVTVTTPETNKTSRAMHGLTRMLVANMVEGVSKGFEKRLLIFGTGYGCNVAGRKLHLNVGFVGRGSKDKPQFEIDIPQGLEVVIETAAARGDTEPAKMLVKGFDKQLVGQFTAEVRRIRPPEPYKGKGIRYDGEYVRRKQGKALAGAR